MYGVCTYGIYYENYHYYYLSQWSSHEGHVYIFIVYKVHHTRRASMEEGLAETRVMAAAIFVRNSGGGGRVYSGDGISDYICIWIGVIRTYSTRPSIFMRPASCCRTWILKWNIIQSKTRSDCTYILTVLYTVNFRVDKAARITHGLGWKIWYFLF